MNGMYIFDATRSIIWLLTIVFSSGIALSLYRSRAATTEGRSAVILVLIALVSSLLPFGLFGILALPSLLIQSALTLIVFRKELGGKGSSQENVDE